MENYKLNSRMCPTKWGFEHWIFMPFVFHIFHNRFMYQNEENITKEK